MITDLRKPMGIISAEAGMERPRLTKFRHTYATVRLLGHTVNMMS